MKEKKPFKMPEAPCSLSDIDLPPNVIKLEPKRNDLQMRVHNILMNVRHSLKKDYAQYPDDSKD
jgi:hypothetical protein